MIVELKHNGVLVDNGLGGKKVISYESFIAEISKMATEDTSTMVRTLGLPEGAYVLAQNGREATIGMYYPSRRATLDFNGTKFKDVLLPNVVIMVGLNNFGVDGDFAILDGIHWFCTDLPLAIMPRITFRSLNDLPEGLAGHVWCLPFPNMYSGMGCSMCTGSNSFISRFPDNQLAGISSYYNDLFIGSRFNNDLGQWMIQNGRGWPEWLRELTAAEEFPYNRLRS